MLTPLSGVLTPLAYVRSLLQGAYPELNNWYSALQNASSTRVHAVVVGDSITEGFNATDRKTLGYVPLLRDALQTAHGGAAGIGIIPLWRTDYWTVTGSWSTYGVAPYGFDRFANGTANKYTITLFCDSVTIYHTRMANTAAFTVNIDGVPNVIGSSAVGDTPSADTISCGSLGNHTIEVLGSAVSGKFTILWGASANIGSAGVQMHNIGQNGRRVTEINTANRVRFFESVQPKLTILGLTTNDYSAQTALSTFESSTRVVLDKAALYGDIVLVAAPYRNDAASKPIPQSSYNAVYQALATEYNAVYLSVYDRWGIPPNATYTSFVADNIHPNNAGHDDIKTYIYNAINI